MDSSIQRNPVDWYRVLCVKNQNDKVSSVEFGRAFGLGRGRGVHKRRHTKGSVENPVKLKLPRMLEHMPNGMVDTRSWEKIGLGDRKRVRQPRRAEGCRLDSKVSLLDAGVRQHLGSGR